jgi:hypothetical protein
MRVRGSGVLTLSSEFSILGSYPRQGSGLGGGTGSDPSAIKTTAPLISVAGRLWLFEFENGTSSNPEKTATAADRINIWIVLEILNFVIFVSLD